MVCLPNLHSLFYLVVLFLELTSHVSDENNLNAQISELNNCFKIFAGAYLNIIRRTAKFLCPADIIPPYIEVDLSELDAGQRVVVGDLKVHPALMPLRPKEDPVCKIMGSRATEQKKSK